MNKTSKSKVKPISLFDDNSSDKIYPWLDGAPDCKTQTAGDWFNILMSASMGGRVIHGSNTAPTCEVLCKAAGPDACDMGVGIIRWDPTVDPYPCIGPDLSDKHYSHHAYRGSITSSGNVLAYESGAWEPSMRTRARSTSLLAAAIHAHGCSKEDAVKTVSIIASDDIDEEAVESTLLPASHLKREMTIVSKASHRIFTKGSLQSSIIWDDSDLSLSSNTSSVAFDWGRVTAIARYIAEANIQCCPRFREYAQMYGLPYHIVRNSWAYVSATDYQLRPGRYAAVPKIDIARYDIPSLKGSFTDHEQDILVAVTRSLDKIATVPDSDTFRAYRALYNAAKQRRDKLKSIKPAGLENVRIIPAVEHRYNAHASSDLLSKSTIPWDMLVRAVATRYVNDPHIRRVINEYKEMEYCDPTRDDKLDLVTRLIMDRGTWSLALVLCEESEKREDALSIYSHLTKKVSYTMKLNKLKSTMFGFPVHLANTPTFSNSLLLKLRDYTVSILSELSEAEPAKDLTQSRLASLDMQETSHVLSGLATMADKHLPNINSVVSDKFQEWADQMFQYEDNCYIEYGARFSMVALALKRLCASHCMNKSTGFIDGADPRYSYIYLSLQDLGAQLNFTVPPLARSVYTGATQLVADLINRGDYPFDLEATVLYVNRILEEVIGDMMADVVYEPPDSILEEAYDSVQAPGSPGYDCSIMEEAEAEARLAAVFLKVNQLEESMEVDEYKAALNSYPTVGLAEQYARVMGYPSFQAAFDELKEKVIYMEGSGYIIQASMRLAQTEAEEDDELEGRKRPYDSIM